MCKEMNAGWAEWVEGKNPVHQGAPARGELACPDCGR